ncbi:MAG: hypothetical protein KF900_06155 [Bacteroidetes bacterium]|nr:hypothetical protein [Bacteroidota bacterium]
MKYTNIREEELKNKIAQDYFWLYDTTKIIGNVDFCVATHQSEKELFEQQSLLWAEAKKGKSDIYNSIVQLILTIGKARTFDKFLPPAFLGAFDGEKIAFIPYNDIADVFYQNDFNWNVTPSNYDTKEFKQIHQKVKSNIDKNALLFYYTKDDKELKRFIKQNFVESKRGISKIKIDKNNFMVIYNKWVETVKPSISFNWEAAKKHGIIDGDFYLADLLSDKNTTLKENLFVVLNETLYEMNRHKNEYGAFTSTDVEFNDSQKAHTQFWNKYERPPKQEYWDYIIERRDLLVPPDIRERKGSFFTPQIWVELSQKYIADVLGDDWQDEYTVWDCAAGTGNLLTGLTNKYNIWASTLDKADVDVMKDRIKNGANLLEDHVFQFDFLNDEFTKLPQGLQDIINDEEKRKKLLIYINPPYAEHGNKKIMTDGNIRNKSGVAISQKSHDYFQTLTGGRAARELFVQFFTRIYREIPNSMLAEFSTLKILQAPNFSDFRKFFQAKLEKIFLMPANTFDNVKGQFPIGFFIWKTEKKEIFEETIADVYDKSGEFIGNKILYAGNKTNINKWATTFYDNKGERIGYIMCHTPDFQHNINVWIAIDPEENTAKPITAKNLIEVSIYLTVRKCIEASWLNDRDQFLYPNDEWKNDFEFQNDCLAYTLFNNNIQSKFGTNHWIPFSEKEINARDKFASSFMTDFINGKLKIENDKPDLFGNTKQAKPIKREFSNEAQSVFNAGRELWKYYHAQKGINVNASLYDIREHFQGRNDKGKMNNKSQDEHYMKLIGTLRENLKILANKIAPKVYDYGFLKK